MSIEEKAKLKVNVAALLVYFAHRVLGATKEHSWNRAKIIVSNAVIDKTVELTGLKDPRK